MIPLGGNKWKTPYTMAITGKKLTCFILYSIFLFSLIFRGLAGVYDSNTKQQDLELILNKCAEYCEKLARASLYFICREEIVEELVAIDPETTVIIRGERVSALRRMATSRWYRSQLSRYIDTKTYVYDYQLIRKNKKIEESRTLIEENGEKRNEKNANLKTLLFEHKYMVFGPIGLLSQSAREFHNYKVLRKAKYKGESAIIIEINPKASAHKRRLYGKVWVKDNDCSILKVEWYQESIENYQYIEKVAKVLAAKPRIKLVTEYDYEKNGLRFPGRYYVEEAYMVLEFGKFVRSRKDVKYRDYKFFTVETEVKIKK